MLLCLATGLALGGGPSVRSADAAPPTTYRDEVLADNPVSYWRFNEASGTAFVDDKGANNGTFIGPVSLGQPGAIVSDPTNKSASFNGTSAALSVPSSSSLNASSAVSVEVWIKRQNGGVFQAVVGKALNGQSKLENYSIWLNASNQVRAYFGNGTTYATTYSSVALDTNWHQVVATYDNATAKVYVDGVLRGSATSTVVLTPNTNPLLGARTVSAGTYYGGLLDELAVYPSVLSPARVQVHYQKAFADLTPPVVTLSAPANGANLQSSSVTFAGAAGNPAGDSSTVTLKIYAGSSATGDPAQTLTATRQGDNSYLVGYHADQRPMDGAGRAAGRIWQRRRELCQHIRRRHRRTRNDDLLRPASPTNQTSASFSFSANKPSTFTCSLDGAAFSACSSPQSYSSLAAGSHTFQARATDTVGNTGLPATYSWTIDTTPPPAPSIDSTPPNPSASAGASFAFSDSEAGSTFQCSLDGGAFSACSSPQSYSGLADGGHTFQVRAIDEVTNQGSAT